ncbi:MAG: hypothetical protein ACRDTJ_02275, partial [Pseudonocardiaceae bacterium]
DLGSAIMADLTARVAPLTRLRLGRVGGTNTAFQGYDVGTAPLEALVEAENVHAAPTARMRARAGQHFERLLAAHNVGHYAAAYRARYAIEPAGETADAASRRFLTLVAGRVIDGARLYRDLAAAPALPAQPPINPADINAVRAAAQAWLIWADTLVLAPPSGPAGWVAERLEYTFGFPAASADGTSLEADEYTNGQLDWHTFTAAGTAAPGGSAQQLGPLTVVPSAVTYPGMPAARRWEFEDARVDFGAVEANPEDLGRMLLTQFALVYGDDWLLVPLEVPVGALVQITRLDVHDTFGQTTTIGPTAQLGGAPGEWGMFGLTRAGGPPGDSLLIAPALAASLQGRAVEEVLLLRDEAANLAWAVERTVQGDNGLPADRAQAAHESTSPTPPPAQAADTFAYRLRTDVPEHWLPLLPQRAQPTDPSMTFRLGALPRLAPGGTVEPIGPRGRLLQPPTPGADVIIREDEIPREGIRVTRAYQLARWIDGTTHLWLGRRKTVGRGEGSSGLRFDAMDP